MDYRATLVDSLPKKDKEDFEKPDDSVFFNSKNIVTDAIIKEEAKKSAAKAEEVALSQIEDDGIEESGHETDESNRFAQTQDVKIVISNETPINNNVTDKVKPEIGLNKNVDGTTLLQ